MSFHVFCYIRTSQFPKRNVILSIVYNLYQVRCCVECDIRNHTLPPHPIFKNMYVMYYNLGWAAYIEIKREIVLSNVPRVPFKPTVFFKLCCICVEQP